LPYLIPLYLLKRRSKDLLKSRKTQNSVTNSIKKERSKGSVEYQRLNLESMNTNNWEIIEETKEGGVLHFNSEYPSINLTEEIKIQKENKDKHKKIYPKVNSQSLQKEKEYYK